MPSNDSLLDKLASQARLSNIWAQSVPAAAYQSLKDPALSAELMQHAVNTVTSWPGYQATPLYELAPVAKACRVKSVLYKDESERFGLGSFKALGGAFAILNWAATTLSEQIGKPVSVDEVRRGEYREQMKSLTVATATDGNHGRAVAWGAQLAGCSCQIFIHRDVSEGRKQAIAEFGATVTRVDGDYDESLRQCVEEASANNWQIVSDTSWQGYTDIPRTVMAGYTLMVHEMMAQIQEQAIDYPTHVIVQAGVGGLAAGIMSAWWNELGENAPKFIIVESDRADCIYQSLSKGSPIAVEIEQETVMAGLSCGEVSELAWPVLQQALTACVTIADSEVPLAMQCFANGTAYQHPIEAGECAVPGVIALAALMQDADAMHRCDLNAQSRVQVFGCEGATDVAVYERLIRQVV